MDYAVWAWTNLRTGEEFDREYDRVNPAYEAWAKKNNWNSWWGADRGPLRALKGKDADLIRKGHDLDLAYSVWQDIYRGWAAGRGWMHPAEPWNESTRCGLIEATNIFTGKCNDLPDWRTDEDKAEDDKVLADYLAKQAGKDSGAK